MSQAEDGHGRATAGWKATTTDQSATTTDQFATKTDQSVFPLAAECGRLVGQDRENRPGERQAVASES